MGSDALLNPNLVTIFRYIASSVANLINIFSYCFNILPKDANTYAGRHGIISHMHLGFGWADGFSMPKPCVKADKVGRLGCIGSTLLILMLRSAMYCRAATRDEEIAKACLILPRGHSAWIDMGWCECDDKAFLVALGFRNGFMSRI